MSIIFFLFGVFLGSFLLVVVDRLNRNESFVSGRSYCEYCKHTLAWYDLMPVLSYVILLGKCRYCHKKYGIKYPLVELISGICFGLIPLFFPFSSVLHYASLLLLTGSLLVIFFADLFFGFIPDGALICMMLPSCVVAFSSFATGLQHLLTGMVVFLFFLLLFFATKQKGMGFGDVKYAFVMGFLLGFPQVILGLYIAFLTGALVALILVIARKRKFHGGSIAFGPFLVLGTYVSFLGGIPLWDLLLHLLFHI